MIKLFFLLCCRLMMDSLNTPALAVDNYSFTNAAAEEYYQSGVTNITYDGQIATPALASPADVSGAIESTW